MDAHSLRDRAAPEAAEWAAGRATKKKLFQAKSTPNPEGTEARIPMETNGRKTSKGGNGHPWAAALNSGSTGCAGSALPSLPQPPLCLHIAQCLAQAHTLSGTALLTEGQRSPRGVCCCFSSQTSCWDLGEDGGKLLQQTPDPASASGCSSSPEQNRVAVDAAGRGKRLEPPSPRCCCVFLEKRMLLHSLPGH